MLYNFFVDDVDLNAECFYISGPDYNHIKNVLRMRIGEQFLVSCSGVSHLCEFGGIENDSAIARIVTRNYQTTSLPIDIYMFQGLPKSDKLELIIQKTVELGVKSIIPVEMKRSVVKIDDKKKDLKRGRWQSIAESAAKQSKCSEIPKVNSIVSFAEALKMAENLDILLVPYENEKGAGYTKTVLNEIKKGMKIGILIGPEGGFEPGEIESAQSIGGKCVSLGNRILRTETAAIISVGMCMLYAETSLSEEDK